MTENDLEDAGLSSPFRLRACLAAAGEPLLVAHSPVERALRYAEFRELTGLNEDEILTSAMCAVPLPLYPRVETGWVDGPDGPRKRWSGVGPDVMWHPLMWLPDRLAGRYMLDDGSGDARPESDDEFAARLALELATAGLYVEATGEWVDILSIVGLDLDSSDDWDRVAAWLDGADDDLLDAIDLATIIDDPDDPHWAVAVVAAWMDDLELIARQSAASDLLNTLIGLEEEPERDDATGRRVATMVSMLGATSFDRGDDEDEGAWWLAMSSALETSDSDAVDAALAEMRLRLEAIVEATASAMAEQLASEAG